MRLVQATAFSLLLLAAPAGLARAQADDADGHRTMQESELAQLREAGYVIVNVDFKGGTVADYIQSLREADARVNIMLDPEAGSVPLAALQLKQVVLGDALAILDDLEPDDERFELEVAEYSSVGGGAVAPVYRVSAMKQRASRPPSMLHVWSVQSLLSRKMSAENIVGAIETAIALQEDLGRPDIQFHEATGLIVARAHPEVISAIDMVIGELTRGLLGDRSESQEVQNLQAQLNVTRTENEQYVHELHRLMEQVGMLTMELRNTQTELAQLRHRASSSPPPNESGPVNRDGQNP